MTECSGISAAGAVLLDDDAVQRGALVEPQQPVGRGRYRLLVVLSEEVLTGVRERG